MSSSLLEKILKYLIYILLFSSFFFFSHILYLLGINHEIFIFGIGGFEGFKSLFISLIGTLFFIWLLIYKDKYEKENNKLWLYTGGISVLIIISSLFSIGSGGFLLGLSEKHHGGLYYLSLIFIFLALSIGYKKTDYHKTLNIIFIFFGILGFYGIVQKIGLDPLYELYQTRVSLTRVFSTLGNANYLAGLSLILLPLTLLLRNKYYKYGLFIFCFIILILTGSYFGIILATLYFIYLSYSINKYIFIGLLIFIFTFSLQVFNNLGIEKLGSMKARPYIWLSTINTINNSPKSLLIGNGPDTLQEVFHQFKHEKLSIYETSHYTADRSHNMFLDLIYFFGILGGGIIIFFIIKALFISKNNKISASIILFLLFFSFNIPVSVHFIILIILLAGVYKKIW